MIEDEPFSLPFWEGLREGSFLLRWCPSCEASSFPPVPFCPQCGSGDGVWRESSARGEIYSFTRQHQTAPGFPDTNVTALVDLDDGPRLLTAVDAAYDDLSIGTRVVLEPYQYDGAYDRGSLSEYPFFRASTTDA